MLHILARTWLNHAEVVLWWQQSLHWLNSNLVQKQTSCSPVYIEISLGHGEKKKHYLLVVNSSTKWSEMQKNFLHKIFARFGLLNSITSNKTQFMSIGFKFFLKSVQILHITCLPLPHITQDWTNAFKRVSKKKKSWRRGIGWERLEQFLSIFRLAPNTNEFWNVASRIDIH